MGSQEYPNVESNVTSSAPPFDELGSGAESGSLDLDVPVSLQLALIQTFASFQQYGLADSAECNQLGQEVRQKWSEGLGADPLEVLALLRYKEGDDIDEIIESLSRQMAQAVTPSPVRLPFLARLIPPSSFYEKYPSVAKLCELMMVLVSYNEDADIIGLTSINPCFSEALSSMIIDEMKTFSSVKPIISITRVDYTNWKKMYKKHFRKGGQR